MISTESGCYIGHFQCDAGACIPNIMVCDGFVNCDIEGVNDTSDEANCTEVRKFNYTLNM